MNRLHTFIVTITSFFLLFLYAFQTPCLAEGRYGSLAIGVPYEDFTYLETELTDPGAVNIIVGSDQGLDDLNSQIFDQRITTMNQIDVPGENELFGLSLAAGDFNGDGYMDLATGVPFEKVDMSNDDAGQVDIVYGGPGGLDETKVEIWHMNLIDNSLPNYGPDEFGTALAAGDFNGDRITDLAIGMPRRFNSVVAEAGAVCILYGTRQGLKNTNTQLWSQGSDGLPDAPNESDRFGAVLTAGDFNGDNYSDLAVSAPGDNVGAVVSAGSVTIIYGSSGGLTGTNSQIWSQDSTDVEGTAETSDGFGEALAAGDFNADGFEDLAIGVPYEDINSTTDVGMVNTLYGTAAGLTAENDQDWHQDTPDIEGINEEFDEFGASLATGDFNKDSYMDLAIGVPLEDVGTEVDAGAVNIIYGSASRLTTAGNQIWTQDNLGITGCTSDGIDIFGHALASQDFNGDGYWDLAAGSPYDITGTSPTVRGGSVSIIYGSDTGLAAGHSQLWHQDSSGIPGGSEANDRFGDALIGIPPDRPRCQFQPAVMLLLLD